MIIRRYESRDKKEIFDLHVRALEPTGALVVNGGYDEDFKDVDGIYLKNSGEFLVGTIHEKIVAMGALKKLSEDTGEIKRMRVDPDFQRQGLGQIILDKLESRALELGFRFLQLDTSVIQEAAQKFYEKNGYKEFKREKIDTLECIYYKKML